MEFWRIYRVVLARRWMILALMLIALVTVWAAKRVADDQTQYTATSVVFPSKRAMEAGGVFQDNRAGVLSPTYDRGSRLSLFIASIKNQQESALDWAARPPLQQKREVARALSNQLNGRDRVRFAGPGASEDKINALLQHFRVPTDPAVWTARTITPPQKQQIRDTFQPTPHYEEAVNATPGGNNPTPTMTDYIQIPVHATSPQLAMQLANLTAALFVNAYRDSGNQEYQASIGKASQDQRQAKAKLDQATNALLDFKRRTGIFDLGVFANNRSTDLETLRQSGERAQVTLDQANQSVSELTRQLSQIKPRTDTVLDPHSRPEVLQTASKLIDEQSAVKTLANRYTPDNPKLQMARAQFQIDKDAYHQLLQQPYITSHENQEYTTKRAELNTQKTEAARARATVQRLTSQIRALQVTNSSTLPQAEKQFNALKTAIAQAENNNKAADQRYTQLVSTNKALDNGLITLNQAADLAQPDAAGPGLVSLLIYAGLLSLIIGIALAIGLDSLDNRVQTSADAEKLLGMPISAQIPALPATDPRKVTRLLLTDPLSPGAEAYRLLRTDLLFTAEDKPFKSLMCATAKPGQGATTTICNLAVALAQVGKRVILIDADLRRPHLHEYFGVSNETGLTSLLRNECEMEEALKLTDIDNLLLLPSGPLPLNPAELLASARMRTLHERMKPHTDFILVDTPSAIAFSDSAILASFMDAVLLVMRAQEAPRGGEARVKELLTKARANIVGVVLNGVKPQLVDSAYYHSAYYPQITTTAPNAGALPPPSDAAPLGLDAPAYVQHPPLADPVPQREGYEQTLMGVRLNHAHLHLAPPASTAPAPEETASGNGHAPLPDGAVVANPDGLAESTTQVKQLEDVKPSRSRFSLRSLFGTDDTPER